MNKFQIIIIIKGCTSSATPPASWLVNSLLNCHRPQVGSTLGPRQPSSSLRSAQSAMSSHLTLWSTQPPPNRHWKSVAPQEHLSSSSPPAQSGVPSQVRTLGRHLPSPQRNSSREQKLEQATSSSPPRQSGVPSHFHEAGMHLPLGQANSSSSQAGKAPHSASSWPSSQSCRESHTWNNRGKT